MPMPEKDNVIRLVQRNAEKRVVIQEIGPEVVAIVRRGEGQLKGHEVDVIFPARVRDALHEFVDYAPNGADVAEVLRKVMRMTLVDVDGREQAVDMKIDCVDVDGNDAVYEMRITPSAAQRDADRPVSDMIRIEGEQLATMDPQLHIPDRESFQRYLDLASYVMNRDASACVVGLVVTGPHPVDGANMRMLMHVAELCKGCLRQEDVIARLDERSLGFMLMDTNKTKGAVALRRMRDSLNAMSIADSGGGMQDFAYLMAFDDMQALDKPHGMMQACDAIAQHQQPVPVGSANAGRGNVVALR
jgi:hypothetical protein